MSALNSALDERLNSNRLEETVPSSRQRAQLLLFVEKLTNLVSGMLCFFIDCCSSIRVQECIVSSSEDDEVYNIAFSYSEDGSSSSFSSSLLLSSLELSNTKVYALHTSPPRNRAA